MITSLSKAEKKTRILLALLLFLLSCAGSSLFALEKPPSNVYVIRRGDSLSRIASRFQTSVESLRKLNFLGSDRIIEGGWIKVRPDSIDSHVGHYHVHRVGRGDTLAKIARRYRTSISAIKEINGLTSDLIRLGDQLRVTHTRERLQPQFDTQLASSLARNAAKVGNSTKTRGWCLRGVRRALNKALSEQKEQSPKKGKNHLINLGSHAAEFKRDAVRRPKSLCQRTKLVDSFFFDNPPTQAGTVYLYNPGRCGFHHMYGHVEVLVDAGKKTVCSDHCRTLGPYCKPDMVLVPVTSCEWL